MLQPVNPLYKRLPVVKVPIHWVLVFVIMMALGLNLPIAQSSNLGRDLSIVIQILEITPWGRSRRRVKLPLA